MKYRCYFKKDKKSEIQNEVVDILKEYQHLDENRMKGYISDFLEDKHGQISYLSITIMPEKITMPMNLLPEGENSHPEKPGDASVVKYEDHLGLVWCCPKCGEVTATANGHKHVYDPATKSLTPSIVHSPALGGCGWHGFLTNGVFKEC